ncbi:MAG: MerR family transcriptional regulator [Lachnospiraceae bacterium]|nr:MerR family transcriptional regulator [Lachnospiraceae bacterium]
MLKIGDFSKLTRISIRMLRHYDEIGLLKPESIDNFTSYRYYSAAQLPLANRISVLKNMGFSLAAISEIMSQYHDAGQLKAYLQIKLAEVKEQAEQINDRLHLLETTIQRLRKDDMMMKYDVTLKEMPERYVASVRKIIPNYECEGVLWREFAEETQNLNLKAANPEYCIAIFHDPAHVNSDVDVEVQMSVIGEYKDTENMKFRTVPPIPMVSVTFKGSYEQIAEISESVAKWVTDNNYEFNGAMFNIYHVSPGHDPNPENWVTEVCYPVGKK